jgi:hypothetical protein
MFAEPLLNFLLPLEAVIKKVGFMMEGYKECLFGEH